MTSGPRRRSSGLTNLLPAAPLVKLTVDLVVLPWEPGLFYFVDCPDGDMLRQQGAD